MRRRAQSYQSEWADADGLVATIFATAEQLVEDRCKNTSKMTAELAKLINGAMGMRKS